MSQNLHDLLVNLTVQDVYNKHFAAMWQVELHYSVDAAGASRIFLWQCHSTASLCLSDLPHTSWSPSIGQILASSVFVVKSIKIPLVAKSRSL